MKQFIEENLKIESIRLDVKHEEEAYDEKSFRYVTGGFSYMFEIEGELMGKPVTVLAKPKYNNSLDDLLYLSTTDDSNEYGFGSEVSISDKYKSVLHLVTPDFLTSIVKNRITETECDYY